MPLGRILAGQEEGQKMSLAFETQEVESDIQTPVLTQEEMYREGLKASTGNADKTFDLIDAHKWFNLAAMQGSQEARIYRAELSNEMTAEEIAEAQRRAREYLATHGAKHNA